MILFDNRSHHTLHHTHALHARRRQAYLTSLARRVVYGYLLASIYALVVTWVVFAVAIRELDALSLRLHSYRVLELVPYWHQLDEDQ